MGIGDWGLGIGDWGLGIGPNPQSPIPNPHPQSPISQIFFCEISQISQIFCEISQFHNPIFVCQKFLSKDKTIAI
jgi:hypothetical protein